MNSNQNRKIGNSESGLSITFIASRAVALFLPLMAITSALLYWIYLLQVETEARILTEQEQGGIDVVERVIKKDFQEAIEDLVRVAEHPAAIAALRDKNPIAIGKEKELFALMVEMRGAYDQVRLIDSKGMEIVRVDLENGRAFPVPLDKMQNKRNRYYFQESIGLGKGKIYISDFDLNVESGQIERPFKPVIRLATPVIDHDGNTTGIIVLNYLGARIFEELSHIAKSRLGTFFLVNAQGYYLKVFDAGDEWGFQLKERADKRFQSKFPDAWETILRAHDGRIYVGEDLLIYHTIHPGEEAAIVLKKPSFIDDFKVTNVEDEDWIIISYIPAGLFRKQIAKKLGNMKMYFMLLAFGIGAILLTGSILLSYLRLLQLRSLAAARQMARFADYNPAPVLRLDSQGFVKLANSRAAEIFGPDLLGKYWPDLRPEQVSARGIDLATTTQEEWGIADHTYLFTYLRDPDTADTYIYGAELTERKKAEEEIQRLASIVENSEDSMISRTPDGVILSWNAGAEKLYGYLADEAIGKNIAILIPDSKKDGLAEISEKLCKGEPVVQYETVHKTKEGSLVDVSMTISPVKNENGELTGVSAISRDISKRKVFENRLRDSELRHRSILELAADAIITIDEQGLIKEFNRTAEVCFGYSAEEIIGQNVAILAPEPYRTDHPVYIERYLKTGISRIIGHPLEIAAQRKDGTIFPIELSVTEVKLEKERLFTAIIRDISARKKAEETLRASEKWFATTLHSIGDGVIATDIKQGVTFINEVAKRLTGWSLEKASGKPISDIMDIAHEEDGSIVVNPVKIALETREAVSLDDKTILIAKDTRIEVPIDDSAAPIIDDTGKLLGAVMVFRDITERKKAQAELIQSRDMAEASSRAKSAFLANMSHELRTPLNTIIGLSQVLQEDYFGPLTEKQAQYVANILSSGRHLLALINDILDLSKIEAGGMELELSQVNVYDTAESSLSIIGQKAAKNNIKLNFEAAPELKDLRIEADETKLRQILYNLLSNAAKFTPDGGAITVALARGNNHVKIDVADTGIGIAPEYHQKIFEPFYQVKGQHQKKTSGTGLGMSLCKQMVEMHGGRIWLESGGKNKGSIFSFTLPVARQSGQEEKKLLPSEDLVGYVEGIIQKCRHRWQNFVVFILCTDPPIAQEDAEKLVEAFHKSKRDHDIIHADQKGFVYFIFLDIDARHIDKLGKRINDQVRENLKVSKITCSFELFKVEPDMDSKKILVSLLRKMEQLKEQCSLKSKPIG